MKRDTRRARRHGIARPEPDDDSPAVNAVKCALLNRLERQGGISIAELAGIGFAERDQAIALRVLQARRFIDIVPGPGGPVVTLSGYAKQALELVREYEANRR